MRDPYFLNRFLFPDEVRPSLKSFTVGNATRSVSDNAGQYLIV